MELSELLDAVSARTPAPGGGSTAAWAGALGAALLEMVAAYAGAAPVAERAAALRAELLDGAERELHAYAPVLRATDAGARRAALSRASDSPLAVARAAAEVAELAAAVAAESTPALRGDAVTGVLLAEAAARAALALVEVNLAGEAGDPRLAEGAELARRAAAARRRVLSRGSGATV